MVGEDYRGMNEAFRKAQVSRTQWPRKRRFALWEYVLWYLGGGALFITLVVMWFLELTA